MKRFLCLCMVAALLVTCVACSAGGEGDGTTTESTTSTTVESSQTTKPTQSINGKVYNALTGAYDLDEKEPSRPVGIMVPNDSKVIGNQIEIDKADFYFECETEGAIPRLMTVFASVTRIPDTYGPVRSARTPFVATARALGAVYVHAGGSVGADKILESGVMDRVNALAQGSKYFWRDPDLKSRIDHEHSLVTGDELVELLGKKAFSTERIKDLPFTFGDKKGATPATTVQLNTTPSHRATFVYDASTGLYGKNIGTIDSYKPHKSLAGNQIQVANVLVVYGERFAESSQHIGFREGTGTAYLFSGGTYRKLIFNRTDSDISFTEEDGTPAIFAQGKIYMVMAEKSLESKIVMK